MKNKAPIKIRFMALAFLNNLTFPFPEPAYE